MKGKLNEETRKRFSAEAERWERLHEGEAQNIIQWEIRRRKELTAKEIDRHFGKQKMSILEVGCGAGENLAAIVGKKREWKGMGVDIADGMVKLCKEQHPTMRFKRLNIDNEKLDERFEVIFLLGVVGYLEDLEASFANLDAMLQPGGLLIFTYGNRWSLFRWLRGLGLWLLGNRTSARVLNLPRKLLGKKPVRYEKEKHGFKLHSKKELKRALRNGRIIRTYNIGFGSGITGKWLLPLARLLERIFGRWDPLNLSITKLMIVQKEE